ncbi:transporter substrate-binding domain-containing protein [bacterium]|nr:transporter substrate-binding domain-containing protein [bacterium]
MARDLKYKRSIFGTKTATVLLYSAFLLLVSCGRSSTHQASQLETPVNPVHRDLDEITKDGKLTVLMGNSSSSYFIYRGRPMGFEFELLELFARENNLELEVVIPDDLNDVFDLLNEGKGDIVAAGLTVTKERAKEVAFTDYLMTTRQVLVQRKPAGWETMTWDAIRRQLLRSQLSLIGKEVYVRKNSSYYSRLQNLSDEIGGDIHIVTVSGDVETEELIRRVAVGDIDYTVADEHIAQLNATYYANLDVGTPISFPQQLAWAVRQNSPELKTMLNDWIVAARKKRDYNHLVMKYYKNQKAYLLRSASGFHSQYGGRISIYDEAFKKHATEAGWDWRLIASVAYQESKFNNELESWAGARGLMQLLPETARRFGGDSIMTAEQSIVVGINYLNYLNKFWLREIPDSATRLPFVLASYNAGIGHVVDAQRLAAKYYNDKFNWKIVSYFLLNKNQRRFYSDNVVKHGYCRGAEPVKYVSEIINRFEQYKKLIPVGIEPNDLVASR